MDSHPPENLEPRSRAVTTSVLFYWTGYVAIALVAGLPTTVAIASEVWQHTAWDLLTSLGLLYLARLMRRADTRGTC